MLLDSFVKEYEELKERVGLGYPARDRFEELSKLKVELEKQDFKYSIYKKHVMGDLKPFTNQRVKK